MPFIELRAKGMNLRHTFLNGQCFRWWPVGEDKYLGVVGDRVYEAQKADENTLRLYGAAESERTFLENYFDSGQDYVAIEKTLSASDPVLTDAIAFGSGMRLLRQEPWEVLVSFILSVQKNIASTQKTIECLCEGFGEKIDYKNQQYYTFPTAQKLADVDEEMIRLTKCGFRAKGVLDAAYQISENQIVLTDIFDMPYERAKEELQKIYGIGEKVADCILLFAFAKHAACPVDTWIKKALDLFYHVQFSDISDYSRFAREKWGEYSGYAQQYLFYYIRENYKKMKNKE